MLNVIVTTENVDVARDGHEITVTTWTVGGYTLVRTECPALDRVSWKVHAPHDLPSVIGMSVPMSKTTKFGVNWDACGTQTSVDTRAYAAQLTTAADVADVFNRIVATGN